MKKIVLVLFIIVQLECASQRQVFAAARQGQFSNTNKDGSGQSSKRDVPPPAYTPVDQRLQQRYAFNFNEKGEFSIFDSQKNDDCIAENINGEGLGPNRFTVINKCIFPITIHHEIKIIAKPAGYPSATTILKNHIIPSQESIVLNHEPDYDLCKYSDSEIRIENSSFKGMVPRLVAEQSKENMVQLLIVKSTDQATYDVKLALIPRGKHTFTKYE